MFRLIASVLFFVSSLNAQVVIATNGTPTLAPHDCYCGTSCKCDPCECNVAAKPKTVSVMQLIPSGNCANGQCTQAPASKPSAKVESGVKAVSPTGGCSSCSRGPVRSVIAAKPVRSLISRRPVRGFLGRLFGR